MANQPSELDILLSNLQEQGGVTHYLIFNFEGVPLRWAGWKNTTADYNRVVHISALVSTFSAKSMQYVRELLRPGENDVECFRLRTKTHEMIIAPGPDCTLVVFQASPQEQARQAAAAAAAEKKEEEKA